MRSKRFLTFIFLVLVGSAAAQTPRRNFDRPRTYDAEHYIIRVSFDRTARKVTGDTTVEFRPLKDGLTSAAFDATGITFSSVTLEPAGTPLKFRSTNDQVVVTLDRAYKSTESISIRFKHTATPKKGVYFVDESSDKGRVHSAQIWTQGEADEARHWFPSFDFPSDKATFEEFITAGADETVIANGELVEKTLNADGSAVYHYSLKVPAPTYLLSFVIGKYTRIDDKFGDIPLGYYIYPGGEATARKAFGKTPEMIRVYESLTGVPFQFNKYDQTVVAGFTFGGMENITATTMADTEIFAVNNALFAPGVEDLVSHELAHSWFGDYVTCKNWAELWLNEGFATFMEAAFREKMYGHDNYLLKVLFDAHTFILDDAVNKKRNALYNQNADAVAELFDRPATIYNKGGAVIHTLREEIGDEAFWKGVNLYLTRHKFASVESSDLKAAMEETSGRDLDWFFDQWVYMGGHPKLDVRHVWDVASKTLRVTVTQTQRPDKLTPAAFRLPLELELTVGGETRMQKLNVTKRVETFAFKLPSKPAALKLDPNEKIPIKTIKMLP